MNKREIKKITKEIIKDDVLIVSNSHKCVVLGEMLGIIKIIKHILGILIEAVPETKEKDGTYNLLKECLNNLTKLVERVEDL